MQLQSKRLTLKEISWDDLENIHVLYSLPETDRYNTLGIPKDVEATKELIKSMIKAQDAGNRNPYNWKIIRNDSDAFIGMAGISLSNNRFKLGEIYYELFPSEWRKGYATEVAKLLIKTGFEVFHLHKVEAGVATQNIASIRVLEKSGMTREGLRRKILPIRGEWIDNYHYAIVEDDPRDY